MKSRTFDFTEDIEIWRRFKAGESAQSIAKSGNMGISTGLKIVVSVEREMESSDRFYEIKLDTERCPVSIPKKNVKIPANSKQLEEWLRGKNHE